MLIGMTVPVNGPVVAFDDTVEVEYSQFCLQDMARMHSALSVPVPERADWLLVGGRGGVLFQSVEDDHVPAVRLELWAGPPGSPPDSAWEESGETMFTSDGTELRLWSVTAAMGEHVLTLPAPGDYHVEAFVRGRAGIGDRVEEEIVEGSEQWLVRIWPAR